MSKQAAVLSIAGLLLLSGCAGPWASIPKQGVFEVGAASRDGSDKAERRRLAELRERRSRDEFSPSFYLGPGDVIEVSVPDVPELKQQILRVSPEDTISLPVAGVLHVDGMTEQAVSTALRERLEKYVKDPEVDVFVKEYHSRQVAVTGMVQKPGFYTLMSRSETLLEVIGRAGGMTENASARVIVVPASASGGKSEALTSQLLASDADGAPAFPERTGVSDIAHTALKQQPQKTTAARPSKNGSAGEFASHGALDRIVRQTDPIVIDLSSVANESLLEVPARPGDVIIVPAAGEVMVDGWVQSPGAYKIVPGMTALSAVSAAGGALFSSSALVLRTDSANKKAAIPVDLSRVRSGAESDVPVQAGDVVFVQRSVVGAVPYSLYQLFTKFGTGMYIPVP